MNRKKDTTYGINRLESKNARAAIIQKISADFNLMLAEAYYHNRFLPTLRNTPMFN